MQSASAGYDAGFSLLRAHRQKETVLWTQEGDVQKAWWSSNITNSHSLQSWNPLTFTKISPMHHPPLSILFEGDECGGKGPLNQISSGHHGLCQPLILPLVHPRCFSAEWFFSNWNLIKSPQTSQGFKCPSSTLRCIRNFFADKCDPSKLGLPLSLSLPKVTQTSAISVRELPRWKQQSFPSCFMVQPPFHWLKAVFPLWVLLTRSSVLPQLWQFTMYSTWLFTSYFPIFPSLLPRL